MEKVQAIMYIVFASVGVLAYIVTTVLAIKRKRAKGEEVDIDTVFKDIAEQAIGFINTAEIAYKAIIGNSTAKAGELKLEKVLGNIRDLCMEKKVSFDKKYWTDYVKQAVNLINTEHPEKQIKLTETKSDNEVAQ